MNNEVDDSKLNFALVQPHEINHRRLSNNSIGKTSFDLRDVVAAGYRRSLYRSDEVVASFKKDVWRK